MPRMSRKSQPRQSQTGASQNKPWRTSWRPLSVTQTTLKNGISFCASPPASWRSLPVLVADATLQMSSKSASTTRTTREKKTGNAEDESGSRRKVDQRQLFLAAVNAKMEEGYIRAASRILCSQDRPTDIQRTDG